MVFENLLFFTDLENFAIFLPLITVTNLSTVVISSKKSLRGDSRIIHRPRLRRPCSTAFEHSSDPICPLTSDVTSTRTGIASTIIRTRGKLTVYMCVYIYIYFVFENVLSILQTRTSFLESSTFSYLSESVHITYYVYSGNLISRRIIYLSFLLVCLTVVYLYFS